MGKLPFLAGVCILEGHFAELNRIGLQAMDTLCAYTTHTFDAIEMIRFVKK